MFFLMSAAALLLTLEGFVYLLTRAKRFACVRRLIEKRPRLRWAIYAAVLAVIIAFGAVDFMDTAVTVVHLMIFWALSDLAGLVVRKLTGRQSRRYWQGALALLVTAVYLGVGVFLNYHVFETRYQLSTDKDLGTDSLRVVQISDSHIGNTFNGEGFARQLERIQATDPDLLVITGDFVDDDTTRADMVDACAALGRFKSTYGVYFVFGNHDSGYFNSRDFTGDDLREELRRNNVRVLEDETVEIGGRVLLVGRKDRHDPSRLSAPELTESADGSKYIIMLDHQPNDFAAEAESKADLVLCGHTHGGQMFPLAPIGVAIGANDRSYGLETRGSTTFIVNSGISCWALRFKTATYSEYVIVDIS